MEGKPKKVLRFNWRLALVVALAAMVLGGTLYGLRKLRRTYMAGQALEIGNRAYAQRDWSTAATHLGRYVAVHRKDAGALVKYADAQLHIQPQNEKHIHSAIAAYRQVLREEPARSDDPSHLEAADRVSEVYLQIGMPAEAEMLIARRLEAADDPHAREILALSLAAQRKFAQAAAVLHSALEAYPSQTAVYKILADLMRERPSDVPGSPEAQLRAAVERNPSDLDAHVALADHLLRYDGSEAARGRALKILSAARSLAGKEPAARVRLAEALLTAGDVAAAREEVAGAAKADPRLLAAWIVWARIVRAGGSPAEAGEVARMGMEGLGGEAHPFLPQAAELYLFAGKESDASAVIERIAAADPHARELPLLKGLLAQRAGRSREAVRHWREAAKAPDAPARLHMALAEAYEKAGELQAAARELRAVLDRDQRNVEAMSRLAAVLMRRGEIRAAAAVAAQARSAAPSDPEAVIVDIAAKSHLVVAAGTEKQSLAALRAEAEALLKRSPSSPRVAALVAELASIAGDAGRVAQLTEQFAGDPETRREAALMEVSALWRAGKRDEALARMRAAVAGSAEWPAGVAQLAEILVWLGRPAEAVETLKAAVERTDGEARLEYSLALGRLHFKVGDVKAAKQVFSVVARAFPDDASSRYYLAAVFQNEDPEAAQRLLDEIKAIEGESQRWRLHQAALWIQSPEWRARQAEATALLQENIRSDARDLESQVLLGMAHEKSGNLRLAIEAYRRAFEGAPDAAAAAFYLIGALQKVGDLAEAEKVLDEAARRGVSEQRLAGLRLGQQVLEGDVETAARTAETMLTRSPDNVMLKVFIARLRIRQGDIAAARQALAGLDEDDPNVAMTNVDLLLREKRGEDALAVCRRQIEKNGSALSMLLRARTLVVLGRLDEAEEDYRAVARKDSGKAQSWILLADFLAGRGKTAEAVESLGRALDIEAHFPPAVIRLATLHSRSADPSERSKAFDVLDAAIAAHPENADFALYKVSVLLSRNTSRSIADARAILADVTRRDPARLDAWTLTAKVALADQSADSALEAVARAMALSPDDAARRQLLLLKAEAERLRWPALAAATLQGLWEENRADAGVGMALARALRDAGDAGAAVDVLEALRGTAGTDAVMFDMAVADAMASNGAVDAALERARKAAPPDDARIAVLTAVILARAGRWDQSVAGLASWQDAHPADAVTLLAAAKAFVDMMPGNPSDAAARALCAQAPVRAREVLELAAARHGNNVNALVALAASCQATGDVDRAESLYRKVLEVDASNPMALNNLAWILCEERKRPVDALPLADKGRQLYPDMADIADTRAVIYQRLGRDDDAEAEFRRCLDHARPASPAAAAAAFHYARLLAGRSRRAESAQLLADLFSRPVLVVALGPAERAEAEALRASLASLPVR